MSAIRHYAGDQNQIISRILIAVNIESHAELICTFSGRCYQHAPLESHESKVTIKHVDSEGGRWTARGTGICGVPSGHDGTPCRRACITITEHLPIEFQELPCPGCSRIVQYEYRLECVQIAREEFAFTASIACPRCKKRSAFRKVTQGLQRIKRLKIGPTGFELETHD
jgi:hypothetical protein